jgi:chromate transporter
MGSSAPHRLRFGLYLVLGVLVAAWSSVVLVVVIAACGLTEVLIRRPPWGAPSGRALSGVPVAALGLTGLSGLSALSWVALKVGALSYGGGFVIIPMMEHDAVSIYHWMTAAQFLHAVALGQVTPGPVVQTVAAVGYAAHGLSGGLLASAIAFLPSFLFVLGGARHFQAIRQNRAVGAFLTGAGPATIGAIAGSFIPLAMSFGRGWQWPVLGGALIWLMGFRQGVVSAFGLGALSGLALFALGVS